MMVRVMLIFLRILWQAGAAVRRGAKQIKRLAWVN
jgi:hypothetical protein